MTGLQAYERLALRRAVVHDLGPEEGFAATIPGFPGLIATGNTKNEARQNLASALRDWVILSLQRGYGLPNLATQQRARALA